MELDSANFLYLDPVLVVEKFPKAKFYLAIRDGKSWIVSFIELMYINLGSEKRMSHIDMNWVNRYGKMITPQFDAGLFTDKAALRNRITPLLQDFADFWGRSTYQALMTLKELPPDRRFIIRTKDFSASVEKLAQFAGVEKGALDLSKIHLNKDRSPQEIEALLGTKRLERVAEVWQKKIDALIQQHPLLVESYK